MSGYDDSSDRRNAIIEIEIITNSIDCYAVRVTCDDKPIDNIRVKIIDRKSCVDMIIEDAVVGGAIGRFRIREACNSAKGPTYSLMRLDDHGLPNNGGGELFTIVPRADSADIILGQTIFNITPIGIRWSM